MAQAANALPGPPSSHEPSEETGMPNCEQVSRQHEAASAATVRSWTAVRPTRRQLAIFCRTLVLDVSSLLACFVETSSRESLLRFSAGLDGFTA
eukprot:6732986-Prymnesium_polylepis.1